ncbi:MAG: response regulator [Blastocatellia bacterium]
MPVPRILIVDDETDVANAWRRAMRIAGYDVKTAQTAEAALALCDEYAFDVVILDYIMPSMKGLELLTRMRKVQPLIRSILVSGKFPTHLEESGLEAELKESVEVDVYLHKPVANQRLKEVVERLLAQRDLGDWKDVAKRTLEGRRPTIKDAKEATKSVDKLRKRR